MPLMTVDIDLGDIDTDELMQELRSRNRETDIPGSSQAQVLETSWDPIEGKSFNQLLDAVYEARILNKDERALELIDRLIYSAGGRIV